MEEDAKKDDLNPINEDTKVTLLKDDEVIFTNQLKKPKGFPQKKWDSWSDSAKQNYINVIKASNKLTGRSDL